MFKINAGTQIQVFAPFGKPGQPTAYATEGHAFFTDTQPWRTYTTPEDKIYSKEQVWDLVAVLNSRPDVPLWASFNIRRDRVAVLKEEKNGKTYYAMVPSDQITYLD